METLDSEQRSGSGPLYISHPGDYTGDTWHAAAAMVLNPRVRVVLTVSNDSKEVETAPSIDAFYHAIRLGDRCERVTGVKLEKVEGKVNGKPKAYQHRNTTQTRLGLPVGLIYQSTSVILREIATQGLADVRTRLQLGLCADLSDEQERKIKRRAKEWLDNLFSSREGITTVVLINGRMEGYNPQHNLDADRLKDIATAVSQVPGAYFLVMGNRFKLQSGDAPKWLTEAHPRKLEAPSNTQSPVEDLFDVAGIGSQLDRWRGTAAFWREVANSAYGREKRVKFVGGRSGSTDIAAFMGVDVLSWDHFLPDDIEYLRMRVTAPDLMRVCHLPDGKKPKTAEFFVSQDVALLGPAVCEMLKAAPNAPYVTPPILVMGSKNQKKLQQKAQVKKKLESKDEAPSDSAPGVVVDVFNVWRSLFLVPEWIPRGGQLEVAQTYAVDGRSFPTI
ncbi:hypothetical protein D7X55_08110 [Corallococcus sp. AB049A]|uniref:Uncharacterized protein n=1 Tax=Corallococcus interemptor TaxID=2316720 RepID=A0A3A8QZX8_9BACT|nr:MULTISPECIES: hypothetical protein [Corallococcus]RKH72470.1 hypothetical protein D7X96_05155 [Corallococcus interemptor]RKI72134.1 hypothetical protein D7X55_08110 [Corallococcus sp. AB049A]